METPEVVAQGRVGEEQSAGHDSSHGRHTATGTLMVFAAQALILPTGLLTAGFLTRQLGPAYYGLFTVSSTIILWIEVNAANFLGAPTVKFLAEADDWRDVASMFAQAQFWVGLVTTTLVALAAPLIAHWFRAPELAPLLRLFAIDILVFGLASSHMSILTGRGAFGQRALPTATRMLGRMVLVFLLVGLGLSITGAILASIGASIIQLLTARLFVRPKLIGKPVLPPGLLAGYALPLFLFGVGMRLFSQLGLWLVQSMGQDPVMAGFYGAAQNLTTVPSLFAISLAPLLLSTLSRLLREQQTEQARAMMQQGMRLILCMLPFAGMVAGSAPEIATLIYGRAFAASGPILALLIFSSVALAMVTVTGGILTAASRPAWTFALTWPLVPVSFAALLVVVPRFGAAGAAAVTTVLAYAGGLAMVLGVYHQCRAIPRLGTVIRALVVTAFALVLSLVWHTQGLWVIVEILAISFAILLGLLALGELTGQDLAFAQSLLNRQQRQQPARRELEL